MFNVFPAIAAFVSTGKSMPLFASDASVKPSLSVTPLAFRSIPNPPFAKTVLANNELPMLLNDTDTPLPPLPVNKFPSIVLPSPIDSSKPCWAKPTIANPRTVLPPAVI